MTCGGGAYMSSTLGIVIGNRDFFPDHLISEARKEILGIFKNKNIYHKRFKGNALNEIDEVKKGDGTPFKVFTPFWRTAEKFFSEKIPSKERIIKKCKNKTNYFKNIDRFPDEVVHREDLIILRFDAQLFFGNIQFFKELVLTAVEEKKETIKGFIINARAINYIDSTAAEQLYELILTLQRQGIRVMLVGAIGPARDLIIRSKIIKILRRQNLFITSGDATDDFDGITKKTKLQKN